MKEKILEAKKNNKIFKHLLNHFLDTVNNNEEFGKECDSYGNCFDKLFKNQRITLEECDLLSDNLLLGMTFAIYVTSLCPELLLVLQNDNKEGI